MYMVAREAVGYCGGDLVRKGGSNSLVWNCTAHHVLLGPRATTSSPTTFSSVHVGGTTAAHTAHCRRLSGDDADSPLPFEELCVCVAKRTTHNKYYPLMRVIARSFGLRHVNVWQGAPVTGYLWPMQLSQSGLRYGNGNRIGRTRALPDLQHLLHPRPDLQHLHPRPENPNYKPKWV